MTDRQDIDITENGFSQDDVENDDTYEKICVVCRRSESRAGRMITLPGNLSLCVDCLQKAIDTTASQDMQGMFPFPVMGGGMPFPGTGTLPHPAGAPEKDSRPSEGIPAKADNSGQKEEEDADTGKTHLPEQEDASGEKGNGGNTGGNAGSNVSFDQWGVPYMGGFPGIGLINLGDMSGAIPRQQKIKKRANAEKEPKKLDIHSIPAPHKIRASLDEYVIGQDHAKKVISVAVYNHYKRVCTNTMDEIEIEKSNILLIGPTGCGKTYLVKTLARLLDVPLAIADATSLTEAGYIGDDIESVLSKLLAAADNDIERAEQGIVFIDEIDKIAKKKNANQRDVSGESVQQGLLKLLEGSEVEVPVGATSKNAMVPLETVNTKNILFICGGAFPGLEDVIKERLNKQASIGFFADLKDKYDQDPDILTRVNVEDIRKFGMIPEFLGRMPVICALQSMTKEMLKRILSEPKNAILKQYQKLLELDEVKLEFSDDALECIAQMAMEKKTGARALRSIIEEFMLDIMYEIPKDDNIGSVLITRDYIEHKGGPVIAMRGQG